MREHRRGRELFLCLVLALSILITGCQREKATAETGGNVAQEGVQTLFLTVCYTNEEASEIVTEERTLSLSRGMSLQEKTEAVLDILEKGSEEDARSTIPSGLILGTEVQDMNQTETAEGTGNVLVLAVADTYAELSPAQWTVMRTGLAEAFFTSGLVDRIEIVYCDEEGLQIMIDSLQSSDQTILNQYTSDRYCSEVEVTLYFMNSEKNALTEEKRSLSLGMTEPLSLAVVQALLEGPETKGLLSAMPEGTDVNDIVVENGICYVDLNSAFRLNHEGSELLEKLTVYSLVNSLASVREVEYVQILIEGEKVAVFKSYVELDKALEPDFQYCE